MELNGNSGKTILVVDDEPLVLKFVVTALRSHGYHVLEATKPLQALQMQSEFKGVIHLVVSDLTMPGMSGVQLVSRIVEDRPEIQVLFMSGYSDQSLLLLDHGWRLVQKPFLTATLLELIQKLLYGPTRKGVIDHFDTRT